MKQVTRESGAALHFRFFAVAHLSLRATLPPSLVADDRGRGRPGGARRAGGRGA